PPRSGLLPLSTAYPPVSPRLIFWPFSSTGGSVKIPRADDAEPSARATEGHRRREGMDGAGRSQPTRGFSPPSFLRTLLPPGQQPANARVLEQIPFGLHRRSAF